MNRRRALVAAMLVALAGCRAVPPQGPLTGAAIGGAFALTDQDGHTVTDVSLHGRYPLYYFGYTSCPDVCPLDMAKLAKGLRAFEAASPARAAKVQPLFVTVDPARDTPAVLKSWVAAFHPRLVGLTGTVAQSDAVAKAFKVYVQRGQPGPGGSYLVDHSAAIYLFGPDGKPISFVDRDATPAAIAAELDKYVP